MPTDFSPTIPAQVTDDVTAEQLATVIASARAAGHHEFAAKLEALALEYGLPTETTYRPEDLVATPRTAAPGSAAWPFLAGAQALLLLWLGYLYRSGGYSQSQFQLGALVLVLGGLLLLGSSLKLRLTRKQCGAAIPYLLLGLVALAGKVVGLWEHSVLLLVMIFLQCGLVGYLWRTRFPHNVHSYQPSFHRARRKQSAE